MRKKHEVAGRAECETVIGLPGEEEPGVKTLSTLSDAQWGEEEWGGGGGALRPKN